MREPCAYPFRLKKDMPNLGSAHIPTALGNLSVKTKASAPGMKTVKAKTVAGEQPKAKVVKAPKVSKGVHSMGVRKSSPKKPPAARRAR